MATDGEKQAAGDGVADGGGETHRTKTSAKDDDCGSLVMCECEGDYKYEI